MGPKIRLNKSRGKKMSDTPNPQALATAEIGEDGNVNFTVRDPMGNRQGMTVHPDVARELRRVLFYVLVNSRLTNN
jgi:hypothetical protein